MLWLFRPSPSEHPNGRTTKDGALPAAVLNLILGWSKTRRPERAVAAPGSKQASARAAQPMMRLQEE